MLYRENVMASEVFPRAAVTGIFYSQWAYWCTLIMAGLSYFYLPPGSVRVALLLTPILPALLIVGVTYWIYDDCDEFIKLRIIRSAVVTAIVMAFVTFGYFVLELFGFPRVSALAINLVGWSIFNLQLLYVLIQAR